VAGVTKPRLRPWLDIQADANDGILVADGFDDALVGVTAYQPGRPVLAVYDYEKCVKVLRKGGMSEEDAREWMEFNVVGAWVGDGTPVFLVVPTKADLEDANAAFEQAK
jgi:hypothetical protein